MALVCRTKHVMLKKQDRWGLQGLNFANLDSSNFASYPQIELLNRQTPFETVERLIATSYLVKAVPGGTFPKQIQRPQHKI